MRCLLASLSDSTFAKAFVALVATMTLPQWGSFAVSVCTCVYLLRKTLLLRATPAAAPASDHV